jgi:hypothetical protein
MNYLAASYGELTSRPAFGGTPKAGLNAGSGIKRYLYISMSHMVLCNLNMGGILLSLNIKKQISK